MKKTYVFDTSVFLTDFKAIYNFGNSDIIIPLIVLEEIDKHKRRSDAVGMNARSIIRILDDLRETGCLQDGVKIRKKLGSLFVKDFIPSTLPSSYNADVPDNKIIATALTRKLLEPDIEVILVSCDINMRVKCDSLGISTQAYTSEHVIKEKSDLYSGVETLTVEDNIIDDFYNGVPILLDEYNFFPNQFLILISNKDEKKSAIAKYVNKEQPIKRVKKVEQVWGITPKNKEQFLAFDLLLDPNIPIVSLVGNAGAGKTVISLAAALQQIISAGKQKSQYNRLIITKSIQPMGRDLGYLPGNLLEKLLPWMGAVEDNLKFLLGEDKNMLQEYIERGTIEVEALSMIRGRSIQNAFIVVDECQNISRHEIKTILTRVGEGSKIVIIGDPSQIDSPAMDETSNGLVYAIEKLKAYDIMGHITLTRGERSKVATLCSEVL